jgi:hypothetical protein
MTGITNNKIVKIGTDSKDIIYDKLKKIDKIKNDSSINKKKKRCYELKHNKKILNLIDELHWKTINYLTQNYKTKIL